VLVGVWIAVGTVWLTVTFVAGVRARRRWRARALPAESLKGHVLERFKPLADRVEIHRVPDSRMAMATGLWRREIWIGERISAPGHVATALNHELCHLDSGDHYVVHLVSLLERTLWWNPLIWMLGRIARRHLEYHCDQRCKRHLGAHQYRRNLAEMVLDRMPANAFPALNFGRPSGVMKRMERLTMTYSTKPAHVLSLAALGVVLAFGSAALADDPPKPSLLDCKDQLPQGVQYRLEIKSTMNTRDEDPRNQISVTLLDELKPGSVEVPKGAGPYVRCVLDLVGVPEEEYPEGV
jgi:beta-lactamase regulating signal transducer with metallopeptidase domain